MTAIRFQNQSRSMTRDLLSTECKYLLLDNLEAKTQQMVGLELVSSLPG